MTGRTTNNKCIHEYIESYRDGLRETDTCEQDVGGEGVEGHQGGGQQGAAVAPGEAHEGGAPLDGGEGGQVTRGVEELAGGQGPAGGPGARDDLQDL